MKIKIIRIQAAILTLLMLLSALTVLPAAAESGDGGQALPVYSDGNGQYRRLEIMMERGGVEVDYDLTYSSGDYNKYVRSAFDIKTGGATRVSIENFGVEHDTVYIQFFAADYTKISAVKYTDNAVADVPQNCDFVRVEIGTTEELEAITLRFYGGSTDPWVAKRVAKNEVSERLTYKVNDEIHTTSRLILPPNYTIDGEKVPLILWLEGSGSSFSSWNGGFNGNHVEYLNYLTDEGFAVVSIYAWGNVYAEKYPSCGQSYPYPIPTCRACLKEGLEYICSRYNIDADNIHIMSKSQGGQSALFYASFNELNVKSIGMFAPVLDYLSMPGEALYKDTRAAIADDLDFTGDVEYFTSTRFLSYSDEGRAFLRQNLDKLIIMNEAWTNLEGATYEELFESSMDDCETFWTKRIWTTNRNDIYTHTEYVKRASVPVKIWGARDDSATPYLKMVEVVEQLKNGGSVAEMRTMPNSSGAHGAADLGSTRVDVTTSLGVKYESIPVGWVENVEWIRRFDGENAVHTHEYTSKVISPTCTEKGYTAYTCECGYSYERDYISATNHQKVLQTEVAPTCTEDGYTVYSCECGDIYEKAYFPAKGHQKAVQAEVAPTCTESGLFEGMCCSVCGKTIIEQKVISPLGHLESDWIVDSEAQVGVDGKRHTECLDCGAVLKTEKIEALPPEATKKNNFFYKILIAVVRVSVAIFEKIVSLFI